MRSAFFAAVTWLLASANTGAATHTAMAMGTAANARMAVAPSPPVARAANPRLTNPLSGGGVKQPTAAPKGRFVQFGLYVSAKIIGVLGVPTAARISTSELMVIGASPKSRRASINGAVGYWVPVPEAGS